MTAIALQHDRMWRRVAALLRYGRVGRVGALDRRDYLADAPRGPVAVAACARPARAAGPSFGRRCAEWRRPCQGDPRAPRGPLRRGAGTRGLLLEGHGALTRRSAEVRFLEPDTFQWGRFTNGDGAEIRYGWIEPAGELRAVAVLLPGRGAPIEHYFEVIRDLMVRGFAIWAMDWRGQGGSERYLDNPQKSHSLGFERDLADLHQFVTTIVQHHGKPLFLFVGSFGAHVSLRYLHDHPESFDFAVIISPMLGIYTDPFPPWAARWLAWLATAFGFGETYVLGGGDWKPDTEHLNDMVKGSSDPMRCCIKYAYFGERPELRSGSPTYRWLNTAFGSMAMVNESDYLKAISVPMLMASSLADQTVIPAANERACSLMPNCRFRPVEDARHSLFFERDELRNQLFEAFDQFTAEILTQNGG